MSRIPKNASGREDETVGLSGELLIGDDFLVARLGLGTMRLTGKGLWGEPANRSEAIRVVRRAVELGVNFVDTADSYGPDVTEGIIAEALYPYPERVVVATKGGFERPPHTDSGRRASRLGKASRTQRLYPPEN